MINVDVLFGFLVAIALIALMCGIAVWHTQTCKRGDNL